MLVAGTTGKLSGVSCKALAHIKRGAGTLSMSAHAPTHQLLEFDSFTGWNWRGSSAPSTCILYNLDPDKYYHWYDISCNDFVPDADAAPETLRSGTLKTALPRKGCNCIQCNAENQWAEPNMTQGRFMCFSCRSTDKWRYEGQFL